LKKRVTVFVIVLSLLFAINIQAAEQTPQQLLILGDSISTGEYGPMLAHAFGLSGSNYQNLAVGGTRSQDWVNFLTQQTIISSVQSADMIVLSVGGNDILLPLFENIKSAIGMPQDASSEQLKEALRTDPSSFQKAVGVLNSSNIRNQFETAITEYGVNFSSVISEIKRLNPSVKLYVVNLYNPFSGFTGYELLSNFADPLIGKLNQVMSAHAQAGEYTLLDSYNAFRGKGPLMTNIEQLDIHPSKTGHTAIFQLAYTAVTGVPYDASATAAVDSPSQSQSTALANDGATAQQDVTAAKATTAVSESRPQKKPIKQESPKAGDEKMVWLVLFVPVGIVFFGGFFVGFLIRRRKSRKNQ